MSVATTDNRKIFLGSGTTGPFTFDFRFYNNTDIKIVKTVAGVDTALTETTDYTLTGAGSYSGGSVTLSTALNTDEQLTIYRQLPLTQDVDLRNQGAFFAEVHEDVFDKFTMILQQHEETLVRCAKAPVTSEYDGEEFTAYMFDILEDAQTAADNASGSADAATTAKENAQLAQAGAEAAKTAAESAAVTAINLLTVLTETFTATAGQTDFVLTDFIVNPLTKNFQVYVNGIRLNAANISASDNTTIVVDATLVDGDSVEVIASTTEAVDDVTALVVQAEQAVTDAETAQVGAENAQAAAEAARDTVYTYTQVGFMLNTAYDLGSVAESAIYFPTDLGGLT